MFQNFKFYCFLDILYALIRKYFGIQLSKTNLIILSSHLLFQYFGITSYHYQVQINILKIQTIEKIIYICVY